MTTDQTFSPAYLDLHQRGELARRAATARDRLATCTLCSQRCGVDRSVLPQAGACRTGAQAIVASFGPHFGEEQPLVGHYGSGTIFFSFCNLNCVFCQNCEISQLGDGRPFSAVQLSSLMLELQRLGCHNINLVSPSHVIAPVLEALVLATDGGLRLPLVYNTGGYDSLETLTLLDGIVDIYMPDMKFFDSEIARPYLGVPDYAEVNQAAVKEMLRQVGHLRSSPHGVARRGLLVRHLVLPDNLAGTLELLAFIARELGTGTWINLMDQYRPCYHADKHPPLDRRLSREEYVRAKGWAKGLGLQC